jgi:hypothetical protein
MAEEIRTRRLLHFGFGGERERLDPNARAAVSTR